MKEEWLLRLREELLTTAQTVIPRIIIALLIFSIGLVLARVARRWVSRFLDKSRIRNDQLLRDFFVRLVSIAIIGLAIFSSLGQLGWDIRTFLTGLGVTGIIIGFGLRDTLSNFASGLLLLIYRPFRAGEMIEVEGAQGTVQELTIVNMQMVTNEGVRIIMPNSKVWGAKIVNYSLSEHRRIEIILKVPESKTHIAIDTILSELQSYPIVLSDPSPSVRLTSMSEKAATLNIRVWTSPENFQTINSDIYRHIYESLTKAGVDLI